MTRTVASCAAAWLLSSLGSLRADDPATKPLPTPLTRTEMKQMLEDLKQRKPRFELPPLSDAEKEKFGERGGGYEGRLRALYMGGGDGKGGGKGGFGFGRDGDSKATLSYEFKTRLFWIVSRTNNCQY